MSTEPERRLVTVLVTDVVDSTPIAERLGAERYKTLFDEIARLMREQVERFGGTVAQHTGDGILAVFGAPTAHEDDSERAVRAALAIHDALRPFGLEIAAAYGVEVAARAAVNTGPALVLRGDEPLDQLYNALGDTVTVAARLQGHAGIGGTIIGPLTARQVGRLYELDDLGELELKGRSEAVAACLVVGERESGTGASTTPLVGRRAELRALRDGLEELADGRGTIVIVRGEPGIGKSRLVAETRESIGDRVRFLEGTAVAYAETFPYWCLRGVLRDWLGLGVGASDALVRLELKTALAHVLPDAVAAYPFLAGIVGAPLDSGEAEVLSGLTSDSVHGQTAEAVRDVVVALSRELPLCLVVDDLHWADESTLGLLDELLAVTDEEAVGVLLIARSEREHGSWKLGESARQRLPHRLTEIDLTPLDLETSRALVGEAAGAELPSEVETLLAERAGGNPFFLEEALRDLVGQGVLLRSNGSYELAVEIEQLEIPLLVQEALQARLDRLEPATRNLVGVASVVGRSFAAPLLGMLVPGERLAPALGELQRLELVVEERRRPVAEYRFRHGLVQEVAYAGLPEDRRRELHRRTAAALEVLHHDGTDEIAGLLAYHFAEGGVPEVAARWFERAGDGARAQYANDEAAALYDRAVDLYDGIGDGAAARHVLFKIAIGHVTAFEFSAAANAYRAAFSRAEPGSRLDSSPEPTEQITVPMYPPDSFVPGHSYSTDGEWVASHLFRGLVRIDRDLTVLPELAREFELSDDGTRYVFRLRSDVRWHDGVPVTAGDFVWTWQRMREQETETAFLLDPVVSVEAIDDTTLVVRLGEASNTFLCVLGRSVSFPWPSHRGTPLGPTAADLLVGNGPFTLVDATEHGLRLAAVPDWPLPRGNVRDVEITFLGPDNDNVAMWRRGVVDAMLAGMVGRAAELPGEHFDLVKPAAVHYVAFRAMAPPFDDVRMRRAFALALDRARLVDALEKATGIVNLAATRSGLIPPILRGHVHDVGLSQDLGRARELLADAGYPGGAGLRQITVLAPDFGSSVTPWEDELCRQLGEIGLNVRVENVVPAQLDAAIRVRGDAYIWGWVLDVPDPSSVFEPLIASSPVIYRDDDLLELFKRAAAAKDRDERLRLFGEVDRAVVADRVAIVPLAYPASYVARRPWLDGFSNNGYDTSCLDEAVVDTEQRRAAEALRANTEAEGAR